jgi:hypothetical protein
VSRPFCCVSWIPLFGPLRGSFSLPFALLTVSQARRRTSRSTWFPDVRGRAASLAALRRERSSAAFRPPDQGGARPAELRDIDLLRLDGYPVPARCIGTMTIPLLEDAEADARPLRGRCMARPRAGLLRSIQRRDGRVGWTEVGLSVLRSVVRPDGLVDEPGESGGGEQGEEKAARGPPGGRARGLGGMLAVAEERPPARREIDASRSGARVMVLAAGLRTLLPEPARGAY